MKRNPARAGNSNKSSHHPTNPDKPTTPNNSTSAGVKQQIAATPQPINPVFSIFSSVIFLSPPSALECDRFKFLQFET